MAKYEEDPGYYLEILEQCEKKNLDDREKYWIEVFQSNNANKGYNLANGGQETFGLKRERHFQAKLNEKQVEQIIVDLKDNIKSLRQIAREHNVNPSSITNINTGAT